MLFITRKTGERIVIGEDTVIEVIEISKRTVRLGISAPREVPVYREELWKRIQSGEPEAQDGEAEPSSPPEE